MSKEKKPVEQQHVLHSGHDRFGSGFGKHLEIPYVLYSNGGGAFYRENGNGTAHVFLLECNIIYICSELKTITSDYHEHF